MLTDTLLSLIPQQAPFRFVDHLEEISSEHVLGTYTFPQDSWYYQGHFPGNPITPGVILIECMAQIGLVSLGIYLLMQEEGEKHPMPVFTASEAEFLAPVYPGDTVKVRADKVYYRLNKLKCMCLMLDGEGKTLCKGTLSGMMVAQDS